MAEETEIINVGGDGDIASELTLQKLVDAVEKLAGKGGGGAGQKVVQMHQDVLQKGIKQQKETNASIEEGTKATKEATKATISLTRVMSGAFLGALSAGAASIFNLGKAVMEGETELRGFAKHLPLVGSYLAPLVGLLDDNVNAFRNLSQIGATFGDGLNQIRRTAAEAGIPLGEFQELVMANAEQMKLFGGTTASGARNFARLSKEFRDGPGQELMMLGFTAQELNQTLIDYAEFSETRIGQDRRNRIIDTKAAAEYAKNLQNVSALTGKRADQIKEEMNAAMGDQRRRLALAQMGDEAADRFQANMTQAPAALQDTLTNLALGIPDELGVQLGSLSDTFREKAHLIKDMDPSEMNNFLAQVGQELDAAGASFGSAGGLVLDGALGDALGIGAALRDRRVLTEEEIAERERALEQERQTGEGMKKFADAMRTLATSVGAAFAAEGGPLEMMTNTVGDLTSVITDFVKSDDFKAGMAALTNAMKTGVTYIQEFFGDIKEFGFGEAFSNLMDKLDIGSMFSGIAGLIGDGLKSALTDPIVLAAIAAIFAGPKLLSAASSGVTRMFSGMLGGGGGGGTGGGGGGGGRGGGGARAAGNAGKGAGAFVGNLAGGAMKGAAAGLKAFANPTILVGAGILAGTIAAIGAGIAGATWILGKALPTFVEGIESFENVDGEALVSAAKGMAAIAGGMAAFGAGTAVAGLGSLVGGITEGLAGLFGAEDPLTKMKKFSDANLDATKIKNNAEALVAYSQAMAAYGGGSAAQGLGQLVGGIASGITSFFGGETEIPFADVAKFGTYNIDTAKVKNNAEALVAYSQAMAAYSAGAAGGSILGAVGSVFDAVTGFFGGEKSGKLPVQEMIDFAAQDLPTERIRTNAEAVAAFGNAMSSLPANLDGTRSGGLLGSVAGFFSGDKVLPYDRIREFGGVDLGDTDAIKANAESVAAFGQAMSSLPDNIDGERSGGLFGAIGSIFSGSKSLPYDKIKAFSLADLGDAEAVERNASVISAFSGAMSNLPSGDFENIKNYAEALEELTEALANLNEELAKSNDGMFTERASAGELLSGISGATTGSANGIGELNTIMRQIHLTLQQMKEYDERIARNTRGIGSDNIAEGL